MSSHLVTIYHNNSSYEHQHRNHNHHHGNTQRDISISLLDTHICMSCNKKLGIQYLLTTVREIFFKSFKNSYHLYHLFPLEKDLKLSFLMKGTVPENVKYSILQLIISHLIYMDILNYHSYDMS